MRFKFPKIIVTNDIHKHLSAAYQIEYVMAMMLRGGKIWGVYADDAVHVIVLDCPFKKRIILHELLHWFFYRVIRWYGAHRLIDKYCRFGVTGN